MKIIERSVQEIGKSMLVSLPKAWANLMGVKKGSILKINMADNGRLEIAPEFIKKQKPNGISIGYDENFQRRFFKEYFEGYETITINLNNEKEKKDAREFLSRFMNIQIIEESKEKIIIKCFKINELSIEECLKRMHFLSLNLFDVILEGEKPDSEIRNNITKFYYILVMQVRRFLDEGKFAEENQISLIRAMDIRMVAEKIQRITESLESIKKLTDIKAAKEIEEFYSNSFDYFLRENFEKSLPLWKASKDLQKKLGKTPESNMLQILRYSKEISGLVR